MGRQERDTRQIDSNNVPKLEDVSTLDEFVGDLPTSETETVTSNFRCTVFHFYLHLSLVLVQS